MAVLIEGISVVIRAEPIIQKYPGGWNAFVADCPNGTLCADGQLARIGFMDPEDARRFISSLISKGLAHMADGEAVDFVVVDQQRGLSATCEWAEVGSVPVPGHESEEVVACRLAGSDSRVLWTPDGWTYEESLSANFIRTEEASRSERLEFLRHEDGLDVYRDKETGREVYTGRPGGQTDD